MEQHWKVMLGQLQPISPSTVEAYVTESMGVFITKQSMNFSKVEHIHRGYEFVIPFGPTTTYKLNKKTVNMEYNKILPINPEQPHIATEESSIKTLIALFLDAHFLNNIAKSISGTTKVSFENINYAYDAYLQNLLTDFINELKLKQCGHKLITESIAIQVGVYLLRHLKSNCLFPVKERSYMEKKPIARAIDYIHANYQSGLSLHELAQVANLSPYHFSRVFKTEVGKTPMEYMIDVKINHAKELLRAGRGKSITEICFESGFNNLSHFSRTFLKKVRITPTAFIRQLQ